MMLSDGECHEKTLKAIYGAETMISILPIDVHALLYFRGIESSRVEFKASWESKLSHGTAAQVLRTICAYANDIHNLNGGYIVIGVEEQNGRVILPPKGLSPEEIEAAQVWIRGNCNRISPTYQPILSPEIVDDRHILVIWAPGGDNRPYEVPSSLARDASRHYYIRQGSESVEARDEMLRTLMQLTAKVPFDDRRALNVPIEQISMSLVRRYLQNVNSRLAEERDDKEMLRRMRLSTPVNAHDAPRNIALLMFAEDPEQWFPGARIEVVQFAGGARGNTIEERILRGPLQGQIKDCINYLQNLSTAHFQKVPDAAQVQGWVSYPLPAMEESIVNAIYHRSYDGEPEPVKVYLYPDQMEITSYPGPVPGIQPEHLSPGQRIPPVPARNRRIGEFLKELRLAEGRGTGIPKVYDTMAQNGSPEPRYEFDEARTYFSVILSAHPEYVAISALRDAAELDAVGDKKGALERLEQANKAQPSSGTVAAKLINTYVERGRLSDARSVYDRFFEQSDSRFEGRVIVAMGNAYLEAELRMEATAVLNKMSSLIASDEAVEAAILERRAYRDERAHDFFLQAGETVWQDARSLHEFAQTKISLTHPRRLQGRRRTVEWEAARKKLLTEAKEMLQRVLQMDAGNQRHAWAWFNLGQVEQWLKEPKEHARDAFQQARALALHDPSLQRLLDKQLRRHT